MPLTIIFQVMLRFIVNNGRCKDVGGIALWQLMEERQVLHGHSWQSMKERFRSSIVGNLDFFDFLTKEEKRELRKHKARHVLTAPLDSTTALTTSALASALAPAFPSSMRSMLTHTPMRQFLCRSHRTSCLLISPIPLMFLLEVNGPESDVVPIYPHHLQGGQGCAVEVAPTF